MATIINGELAEILFKGGLIIGVKSDRTEEKNRVLVKMPKGIIAEDNRIVQYRQYIIYEESTEYSIGTDYFCDKRNAIKLFTEDVQQDRIMNLRIADLRKKKETTI